jgi:hypothetical protein
MPHAAPQLFQRVAEVALGVSFNTQSQAPDIPGASSCAVFLRLSASLQIHVKTPDLYSLRAYTEELASSLNSQAQAPDDPSQTLVSDFHFLSLRAYMEELSASFNSVIHTFSSNIFAIADKILQGYPRCRTAYTFPFSRCHKTGHRNSLHTI